MRNKANKTLWPILIADNSIFWASGQYFIEANSYLRASDVSKDWIPHLYHLCWNPYQDLLDQHVLLSTKPKSVQLLAISIG